MGALGAQNYHIYDVTCWVTPPTNHLRILFLISQCMYAIRIPKILKSFFTPYHHRSTPSRINALQIFSMFFEELNTSCIAPFACSSLFCTLSRIWVSSPRACSFSAYLSSPAYILFPCMYIPSPYVCTLCVSPLQCGQQSDPTGWRHWIGLLDFSQSVCLE